MALQTSSRSNVFFFFFVIIMRSPVKMKVLPTCEPKKVKVSGPAATGKELAASIPTELTIDTSDAGYGDLEVEVLVSFRFL